MIEILGHYLEADQIEYISPVALCKSLGPDPEVRAGFLVGMRSGNRVQVEMVDWVKDTDDLRLRMLSIRTLQNKLMTDLGIKRQKLISALEALWA